MPEEPTAENTGVNPVSGTSESVASTAEVNPVTGISPGAWIDKLSDDNLKSESSRKILGKYTGSEAAMKGLLEAQSMIGDPKRVLDHIEKLDDEQKNEFITKLNNLRNVPKDKEGYDIDFKAGLPEGTADEAVDEKSKQVIIDHALASGLTKNQAQSLMKLWNEVSTKALMDVAKTRRENMETSMNKLQNPDVWGPNYNANREVITRYLKSFHDTPESWSEFAKQVFDTGVGNNDILMRALLPAAQMVAGEGVHVQGTMPAGGVETVAKNDWNTKYPNSGASPSQPVPGVKTR